MQVRHSMYTHPWIIEYQQRIERILPSFLPKKDCLLHNAMHYATCNGGKRIRPLLVYATGLTFNATLTHLDRIASAIEYIHSYSLIHDDLPAMDNDDFRRGLPTCHKAFDEASAILAGDALHTLAFELLSEICELPNQITIINLLAKAAGSSGMVGGQSLDMQANQHNTSIEQLARIHWLKTGCLFHAAIHMGALASPHITTNSLTLLDTFAHHLGLAFQIRDDILDLELGGQDASQHKATYPALLGMPASKDLFNEHLTQAITLMKKITPLTYFDPILNFLHLT